MLRKIDRVITTMSRLRGLDAHWNDDYQLIAAAGSLYLMRTRDGLVLGKYIGIVCDGGDPEFEERDGRSYIIR